MKREDQLEGQRILSVFFEEGDAVRAGGRHARFELARDYELAKAALMQFAVTHFADMLTAAEDRDRLQEKNDELEAEVKKHRDAARASATCGRCRHWAGSHEEGRCIEAGCSCGDGAQEGTRYM